MQRIEMVPVESSNIVKIGYSKEDEKLRVEFKSGMVYDYFGVPECVHQSLMASDSKGKFFARFIRNNYKTKEI